MSLVWTIIATFLYVEIAVVLLLVLPIASPQRWNRFFKSQFLAMISRQANIYFVLLFGILVLFLLEAIREMRKYSHHENGTEHLNVELQHSMRLFRAQRNFYISGFSIFLTLVIRRLVILISSQAQLLAQSEASMRQAQSATTAARSLLSQQKSDDKSADSKKSDSKPDELIGELKQKISDLNKELERERKDKEALKSQATGLEKEYDRLTEEYSKLERRLTVSGGGKDD
ncbi:B-cell receptor-associated protein 31 isoform X2 [Sitodiplosis mosellana]|uniref:B-cell receptor-associated protein 31 isoform X2 n=1 Tax=Sitodiplosis mosellana TaxID=263140 RepID=UPI0024453462|nr:B-cell receptor-associated protein 31 isoform X2 [Sitodiplosis mosellana]XP_055321614.1 B-cell receptor-associated protein 31 isoform X2 [Sitodiplosis mosellana]XP_055321615.1 B-cell receptor-associated protein 31 isoform X2 [Sitodiplosis mosellana]